MIHTHTIVVAFNKFSEFFDEALVLELFPEINSEKLIKASMKCNVLYFPIVGRT